MAMRRRTHKRKPTQETINMGEARREIAKALHLHRLSSPSSVKPSFDNRNNVKPNFIVSHSNYCEYYCYPILESLPCPEPVWSTTAPSVVATETVRRRSRSFEATEVVEWGENDDDEGAAYSWWLGFLKMLDCKSGVKCVDDNGGEYKEVGGSGLGGDSTNNNVESSTDQISISDDWLLFLTTED